MVLFGSSDVVVVFVVVVVVGSDWDVCDSFVRCCLENFCILFEEINKGYIVFNFIYDFEVFWRYKFFIYCLSSS